MCSLVLRHLEEKKDSGPGNNITEMVGSEQRDWAPASRPGRSSLPAAQSSDCGFMLRLSLEMSDQKLRRQEEGMRLVFFPLSARFCKPLFIHGMWKSSR